MHSSFRLLLASSAILISSCSIDQLERKRTSPEGLEVVVTDGASIETPGGRPFRSQVELQEVRPLQCGVERADCNDLDAIVFVHGIYGSRQTFRNATSNFDWPSQMPSRAGSRRVDVLQLTYDNALVSWAKQDNPRFDALALEVMAQLAPLRKRRYRSIGFVAHSLGGNLVTSYLHLVKTRLGHAHRAQHAYVITLATPVYGSQMADLGADFKSSIGMSDPLLSSLRANNLYLEMLQLFRIEEGKKSAEYGCRPINLHAAYELEKLGPVRIVEPWSARSPIQAIAASPVEGFPLNHSQIAKPASSDDPIYRWVLSRIEMEFGRLESWNWQTQSKSPEYRLCADMRFRPEA